MGLKSNIKEKIRFVRFTPFGRYAHSEYWRKRGKRELKKYDDYTFIKRMYKNAIGVDINLKDPKRMTEKLQWLKLFWRNDVLTPCSDKYAVREYITERGYGDMLNELIGVYDSVEDIDFDSLPNKFVLKATHGSGMNFICKDKSKENLYWWKKTIKSWLGRNLYWYGREWNYEAIKPRIIIEKYLEDPSGGLADYKVSCFGGRPLNMQVDIGRYGDHRRCFVNREGEIIPFDKGHIKKRISEFDFTDVHERMFEIAEKLCEPFPYVRVDFYYCDNRIYIGELTFFDFSGFSAYDPDEYDFIYGKELVLPEPNYNLDLYAEINEGKK